MDFGITADKSYDDVFEIYNNCAKALGRPLKQYGDIITLNEMVNIPRAVLGLSDVYSVYGDYYGWGPLPCETIELSNERAEN